MSLTRRFSVAGLSAVMITVIAGALFASSALAQPAPTPAFGVGYLYEMGIPGTNGRSVQGGGESSPGDDYGPMSYAGDVIETCTSPSTSASTEAAPPLYGMRVRLTPAIDLKSSAARWFEVPALPLA